MWKIIVLSMIPGFILIVQNGIYLQKSSDFLDGRHIMKSNVKSSLELGEVIHGLQKERGLFSLYVSVNGGITTEARVLEAFNQTDKAIKKLSWWITSKDLSIPRTKQKFHQTVQEFRDKRDNVTFEEVIDTYVEFIDILVVWMVDVVKREKNSDIWADLVAYHMLIHGKEHTGIERAIGVYFFSKGELGNEMLLKYKGHHEQAEHFLEQVKGYSPTATQLLDHYLSNGTIVLILHLRHSVMSNKADTFSEENGLMWFDNMTSYIDSLHDVARGMADYIKVKTEEEIKVNEVNVLIDVIILIITFIVAALVTLIIYKISKSIERVKDNLQEKTLNLEKEQQRTETLLSQLVPAKIARRMRTNLVEPEVFPAVTVMFADISNLDTFINRCTPNEFLEMINDVFDIMEKSVAKYNVTRIASTGNILMAASGLHQKNTTCHSDEIAYFSIDVMGKVHQVQMRQAFNERVKLKIGISKGPVIAGVIDGKLPKYCLFGESVAEAHALMESCLPSYIQLSESVSNNLSEKVFTTRIRDDLSRKALHSAKKTYWLCGSSTNSLVHIDLDIQNTTDV